MAKDTAKPVRKRRRSKYDELIAIDADVTPEELVRSWAPPVVRQAR